MDGRSKGGMGQWADGCVDRCVGGCIEGLTRGWVCLEMDDYRDSRLVSRWRVDRRMGGG